MENRKKLGYLLLSSGVAMGIPQLIYGDIYGDLLSIALGFIIIISNPIELEERVEDLIEKLK